ncbi:probable rhamnogalacturonate lyase B [Diospyros lotus]|uniref:probable rhamnogalacturonate lyase B n=1 Tax=Diospyros lotus TaxID=55363 RepID=UPI002251DDEB|nr:probable rhamnogalacturonate lyase B [Diospyros lotus]
MGTDVGVKRRNLEGWFLCALQAKPPLTMVTSTAAALLVVLTSLQAAAAFTLPLHIQKECKYWEEELSAGSGSGSGSGTGCIGEEAAGNQHRKGIASMSAGVQLQIQDDQVVMDNGILQLTLTNPGGAIIGIRFNGIDNLLELHNPELNGGFWDLNWAQPGNLGTRGKFDRLNGTSFNVIVENEDQVELSFTRTWNTSLEADYVPLNIDKRFVLLSGSSGFYSYAIFEHLEDMPALILYETRIAFMLKIDKFHYMAMADDRQRYMPLPDDRLPGRGQQLAYPEAVLLVNPIEPEFKGEVDDKYQYSCENKDNKVHGWICFDPPVGFWQISPSNEFRTGGPLKQDLTSHVNPTTLAMFVSAHYGGEDLALRFEAGEPWKKVFGPVFIYLNTLQEETNPFWLWQDAKEQMKIEVQSWPYSFPNSDDFPKFHQRGTLTGRFLVQDWYVSDQPQLANGAYIGLATLGESGSWQKESKGYQFWTTADEEGHFCIKNIRPGDYNLYAWAPGFIGDYISDFSITITSGCEIDVGDLVFKPPRDGLTLWEIGFPDRSAAEFYVPDPDPKYINKLYINHPDRFRQYGLWERYADLYPEQDLVYTVGVSDYRQDWFYAQVNRRSGDKTYEATTWQIMFELENVDEEGSYKLRLALASATHSILEVRINNGEAEPPHFSREIKGNDNAIARHGIHGLYYLFTVDIPCDQLIQGNNTIFLTQANNSNTFYGIMYDYIRLEAP